MPYFPTGSTTLVERRGYGPTPTGLGGILDTIGNFVKSGASAAVSVYNSAQQSAGQAAAYQNIAQQQAAARPAMSGMVLPIALGGAALVGVLLLTRGKRKNPARRRRHRR